MQAWWCQHGGSLWICKKRTRTERNQYRLCEICMPGVTDVFTNTYISYELPFSAHKILLQAQIHLEVFTIGNLYPTQNSFCPWRYWYHVINFSFYFGRLALHFLLAPWQFYQIIPWLICYWFIHIIYLPYNFILWNA